MMDIVILVELVKAIVTLTIIVWDARINSLVIINMVKRKKKNPKFWQLILILPLLLNNI